MLSASLNKTFPSFFAASNILLARLATRSAKPNGQFYLESRDVTDFMAKQSVKDLPGILCFRDILQFLEDSFKQHRFVRYFVFLWGFLQFL